jgi:outer membrane protein TolC
MRLLRLLRLPLAPIFGLVLLLLAVPLAPSAHAQDAAGGATPGDGLPPPLPPLAVVLRHAVDEAPELRVQDAIVRKHRHEMKRARRAWMQGVSAGVSATAGSYGNTAVDAVVMGQTARVGLSVSLYDLFGRASDAGVFAERLAAAELDRDVIARRIEREVIDRYHAVVAARALVAVRSDAFAATQMQQTLAETAFGEGAMPLEEVARVTEVASKARAEHVTARVAYQQAVAQLEARLDVPLSALAPAARDALRQTARSR